MGTEWSRRTAGEVKVLVSLAVSLGMIVLTVAGYFLWNVLQ